MKLDETKEFDLLVRSIEETSKHARNLLFILLLSSIYVVIAAYSDIADLTGAEEATKGLTLPVLNTEVSVENFFVISPVVILVMFYYFHIYITELTKRLAEFDALDIEIKLVSSPRMLLFPWLFTFASKPEHPVMIMRGTRTSPWSSPRSSGG